MQQLLFLRGLAIGFALAAPGGPVGILCIRRALADGRHAAFVAGLGAAFADTLIGAVTGLGVTVVSSFLVSYQVALRLVGGLFLVALGIRGLRKVQTEEQVPLGGPGLIKDFLSTFVIALTNPATILAAMGVFAGLGAIGVQQEAASGTLILGVFGGSALWWFILSGAASAVRSHLSSLCVERLNRGSGVVLVCFGLAVLASLLWNFDI